MQKHVRLATVLVLVLSMIFCTLFTVCIRADENLPTLYCNDEVWYKTGLYPLRVYNSNYVPISIFEQIRGISITYYENNTAIVYRDQHNFISFNFSRNEAMTQDNERFNLKTYLENGERYVPLNTTCNALGLEHEVHRSAADGSVAVRITDGSQTKTFAELLRRYNPGALAEHTAPPPQTTEPTPPLDPVENAAFLCIDGFGEEGQLNALLDLCAEYDVSVTFFITPDELRQAPDSVLSVIAAGHTLGFLVPLAHAEQTLAEANAELMRRFKQTTRLIRITDGQPTLEEENAIAVAGYARFGFHIDLGRTESDVRAALIDFRQSLSRPGHVVLRVDPDGYNTVAYLREFFKSAEGKRRFFSITEAYLAPVM